MIKRLFSLVVLFVIGCSSVPITTMLKFSSFDNNDIAKIAPRDVQVRLTLDEPVKLLNDKVKLALLFDYEDKESDEYLFELTSLRPAETSVETKWLSSSISRTSYEFSLDRLAQLEFSNFQKSFSNKGKPSKYRWTVYYYLNSQQHKEARIDVELKLSKIEEYFYLIKDKRLEIDSVH
ncbi:MAG: hypothetical protein KUG78_11600 [Kangiellaceae bacterium]|nr:hypothetical protein [Kangiellaceae bacterium]